MRESIRQEDGAGTVLALALTGVLVIVACAVAGVSAVITTHRRAQAAADLAALAGARALQEGGDPCARAAVIARANGAGLEQCRVQDWDVVVTTSAVPPDALVRVGFSGPLRARGRAGPVQPSLGQLWSSSEVSRSSRL